MRGSRSSLSVMAAVLAGLTWFTLLKPLTLPSRPTPQQRYWTGSTARSTPSSFPCGRTGRNPMGCPSTLRNRPNQRRRCSPRYQDHQDTIRSCEPPYFFRTVAPSRLGDRDRRRKVSAKRVKYSAEFKHAAVQEVIERSRPIADVVTELGLVAQTLGSWVKAYRDNHPGEEPEVTVSERARLKELERENRELRMENEFLGKATAFFAKKSR